MFDPILLKSYDDYKRLFKNYKIIQYGNTYDINTDVFTSPKFYNGKVYTSFNDTNKFDIIQEYDKNSRVRGVVINGYIDKYIDIIKWLRNVSDVVMFSIDEKYKIFNFTIIPRNSINYIQITGFMDKKLIYENYDNPTFNNIKIGKVIKEYFNVDQGQIVILWQDLDNNN